MNVVSRTETREAFPHVFKRGVVAFVVTRRGKALYQHGERANGTKTKAVRVPDCVAVL